MSNSHTGPTVQNVVDEVRAARSALAHDAGDLAGLGETLQRIEAEFRARTGRFKDVPLERPASVQALIDAAQPASAPNRADGAA